VERRSQLTTDNCTNHHHRQIGHFGTFGRPIADLLEPLIPELLHRRSEKLLLMGRGSQEFAAQIVRSHPDLAGQIQGVGEISGRQLSQFVGTCDVMIQPYPDGVTSRRTTAMVALSHGVPTVTSEGPLTEDVWKNSGAVRLVDHRNRKAFLDAVCELLDDERQRSEMSHRATKLYAARFDISHTLAALCSSASDKRASDLAGLPA
jgi:glycosyltransferase involved in cell wall biosynthesis